MIDDVGLMSSLARTTARTNSKLVLLRHGESAWNRSMRLTGWTDVPLCERGRDQARRAGRALRDRGIMADVCYSSRLRRAIETLDILLATLGAAPPRYESWRVNERHYGALQGLHWWEAVWRFGPAPVLRCRRDFDQPPPRVAVPPDLSAAGISPADAEEWRTAQQGESLAEALRRFLPLWTAEIAPALRDGACVLIVAHNNLLRAVIRHLEGGAGLPAASLSPAQPWIVELDTDLRVIRRSAI